MAMDSNLLDTIWKVAALIFAAGAVWGELKAIRKDIARLEKKADETNRIKERVGILEVKVETMQKVRNDALEEMPKSNW